MLSKKNRTPRSLFATIFTNGSSFHSKTLSLRMIKKSTGPSKFSFVVSKKVSKSAVQRNLLRRRGYSALRLILGKKKLHTLPVLGVFFLKKDAEKLTFSAFQNEVRLLLKKAQIL